MFGIVSPLHSLSYKERFSLLIDAVGKTYPIISINLVQAGNAWPVKETLLRVVNKFYLLQMIYIRGNKLIFNKYIFYIPIMFALIWHFLVPRLWAVFTYKHTMGVVVTFVDKRTYYLVRSNVDPYPVISFKVGDSTYTALGSAYQESSVHENDSLLVMYDAHDPSRNYINTFTGGWAPVAVYLAPSVFIITLIFGMDTFPKLMTINF